MIPIQELDPDLIACVKNIKPGTNIHNLIASFIISVLERNEGNRTWTSKEIGMALRTLSSHINNIEAMGYSVEKPKTGSPYPRKKNRIQGMDDNEHTYPKADEKEKEKADKWVPVSAVIAVLQDNWEWIRNMDCKYVDLRIDTRDMHCVIFDRDHKLITLDQLKYQQK